MPGRTGGPVPAIARTDASVAGDGAGAAPRVATVWACRVRETAGDAPLLRRVLAARGLDQADAAAFLTPSLRDLHDPSLLPGLDRASERLLDALRRGERVVIYGDYDVDGITAATVLWRTLRAISPDADVRVYIPHRLDEGYGLNSEALATLAGEGARVVVSVDCGITAREPARIAREAGLDLIITDHHTPPSSQAEMPEAFALVHPRLPGSAYPFAELTGAGVAYKLAWRLLCAHHATTRLPDGARALLLDLLALAALGTIADVAPLVGENRVIVRHGLARLKSTPFEGLRALIDASGLGGEEIDAERVAFTLAPRLNACGRLGHAREAAAMLTEAGYARALEIARELNRQNDRRRSIEQEIVDQACARAERECMTGPERRAIVLADNAWHPGVVGIACSRLVERFARPVILLHDDGECCHGSGRSVRGLDLHGALAACSAHLEKFGGHAMAAGMTLRRENLGAFREAFVGCVNSMLGEDELVRTLEYDCGAALAELTPETGERLAGMGPFGSGNPRVCLRVDGLRVAEQPRVMGQAGRHLALRVRQGERWLRVVAWSWGARAREFGVGAELDALVTPKISTWQGTRSVEGELVDARRR